MINVVVFDLDDTLFPEYQFVLSGFRAVGDWINTEYFVPDFYLTAKKLFEQNQRGNIFNTALEQLEIDYDSRLINQLVRIYREHKPDISLYDDANWALNYFKKYKRIGIITDGYLVTQRNKVFALGISRLVDTIVYSDEHGRNCWKPSTVPYLKVMEELGCRGDECVYIGDNPTKDFITARSLGWTTFQICREEGQYSGIRCEDKYQAKCKIASLYDLKEFI